MGRRGRAIEERERLSRGYLSESPKPIPNKTARLTANHAAAEVLQCTDIGQAGTKLVRRDMDRLNGVLKSLEPQAAEAIRVRSKDG